MKKNYIMPTSSVIRFNVEGMLAASGENLGKFDTGDNGGSEGLSQGRGWSADSWTATDED